MGLRFTKSATTVRCALGSLSTCLAYSVINLEVKPFKCHTCATAFKRASHCSIHRAGDGQLTDVCSAVAPFGIWASWPRTAVCTQGIPVPVPTLPVLLYQAEDIPEAHLVEASMNCFWGPQGSWVSS